MRRVATVVTLLIATAMGAATPAAAQTPLPNNIPPVTTRTLPTPLGWYAIGTIGCAAVSPMIATAVLGRELTMNEAYRSMLGCVGGPLGWVIADLLVPPTIALEGTPPKPPRGPKQARGRNITIPSAGATNFVSNEILLEFKGDVAALAARLQLTLLETQTFALTGRTLLHLRIDGTRSVANTLQLAAGNPRVSAGQPNFIHVGAQAQPAARQDTPAQYVVPKMHLLEAHRITGGDDVVVAVIDSQIDTKHPDLAGVFAGEYDALGSPPAAHAHGTGMAGAIAAHSKLLGVAPKVKLLAVRAFAGSGESAQGTTFNILKGLDWAASKNARIVNMSFAGPADPMFRDMLSKAHKRGIVLIAAVGNAGPRSPPLYPAADPDVIGVTATDADDVLLPIANRGSQVAVAAPGVQILAPAPDSGYQVTTGTSVAAAHASGVAALLLARNPKLKPDDVRRVLIKSARAIPGKKQDVGAGVIDALGAVNSLKN
jgi:subtilisin family serine protease